jgi:surface carbohydrate biosynthesis protein (TIGR04326 family)
MKILYIFDSSKKSGDFYLKGKYGAIDEAVLFPLTYDMEIINKVKSAFVSQSVCKISILNSAEMIDAEIINLRDKIVEWSMRLGESKVGKKKLKEWFLIPKFNISSWWLSLLSEKNTWKTNAFLKIAQVNAIKKVITNNQYKLCFLSATDRSLRNAIIAVNNNFNIKTKRVNANLLSKMRFLMGLPRDDAGFLGNVLLGLSYYTRFFLRGVFARIYLGSYSKRFPHQNSLLFATYFPAIDKDAAEGGIFINKYASALQNKLKKINIPVLWLLIYTPINGYTFNNALHLAGKFAKCGEKCYMLEEFVKIKDSINVFYIWLKHILLSTFFIYFNKMSSLLSSPIGLENKSVMKSLFFRSFFGPTGMQGIIDAVAFNNLFKNINDINDCLYYCEMQAWEKSLNAAAKKFNRNIRTIGFQHSAISRNEFQYFYDKEEIGASNGRMVDMPLPDVFACNGQAEYSILSKTGYPNLTILESVRYMYINKILSSADTNRKGIPVLLVAGSYDRNASKELISLVYGAFPKVDKFNIWFKAHPAMPFEDLFNELKIDINRTGYNIYHGNISEYLGQAWSVLTPTGVVAIEAMAYGCEVIVPFFPDAVCISPVVGFEDFYHKVTTPEELSNTVSRIFSGHVLKSTDEYRKFVKSYWDLDPSLNKWAELLTRH